MNDKTNSNPKPAKPGKTVLKRKVAPADLSDRDLDDVTGGGSYRSTPYIP